MIPNDISQSVSSLAGGLGVVIAFMAVGLAIAQHQKKLTVVDTMWGIGFVLIAAETALISSGTCTAATPSFPRILATPSWPRPTVDRSRKSH